MTKIFVTSLCFLMLCMNANAETDLSVSNMTFWGYFDGGEHGTTVPSDGGKDIDLGPGQKIRVEFSEYDEVNGMVPKTISVEVLLSNLSDVLVKDVEVRLSLTPKVAFFVFWGSDVVKMIDYEQTENNAEWFAPLMIFTKRVGQLDKRSSLTVTFGKINLGEVISRYFKKQMWPTEIRFEATVEPKGAERTFFNNTTRRVLKISVPPY